MDCTMLTSRSLTLPDLSQGVKVHQIVTTRPLGCSHDVDSADNSLVKESSGHSRQVISRPVTGGGLVENGSTLNGSTGLNSEQRDLAQRKSLVGQNRYTD